MTALSYTPEQTADVLAALDALCMPQGLLRAVPAAELLRFSQEKLALYGHYRGIYQYPTTELVQLLQYTIGSRVAIEIAAGNGVVGRDLGIPMTDSYLQDRPEIAMLYRMQGQPVIKYPSDVEKLDALDAVAKYRPQVVIGCWATHMHRPGMEQGNMFGIEEEKLLEEVELYVHVGNEATHIHKPVLRTHPFDEVKAPFLVTRSMKTELNNIYFFRGAKA